MGQLEPALEMHEQALTLDDKNAMTYNNLGAVYLAMRQVPKAKEMFDMALSLNPENPVFRQNAVFIRQIEKQIQENPDFGKRFPKNGP